MQKSGLYLLAIALLVFGCSLARAQLKTVATSIIPKPQFVIVGKGYFEITAKTRISIENLEQEGIVSRFFDRFKTVAGWKPKLSTRKNGDISFISDSTLSQEAYSLDVKVSKITVRAASSSGFFYALQSLKQLLPVSFYSGKMQPFIRWTVPVVSIRDKPAFEWRGYMLDVSRHFFTKQQVMKVLDFMGELKLNRFHWHLADDQGWRLEIKSYPKLTETGAWRMDYNVTDEETYNWFGRPVQKTGEKPTYGGFYTQDEVREIIAYAKERHIEVIPEIDMPGHAQATIAAYPEIGCVNAEPFVATGGVVKNNTYNPGKEVTFEFISRMLSEVMDLFPSRYIHIGGDECNKSQWRVDPDAQRRIKQEGLKDENELQSYFIKRVEQIVNAKGRQIIGWDEILEGGLAPNAVVMSWRGEVGGIESVKAGHDVIMSPNSYCYIDLKQGHQDMEPNLGYSMLLLSKSYAYKVIPDSLTKEESRLIKGIQANMWTESITDWGKLTYMTFPRLYAVAENAWTKQENKEWNDFTLRLETQFERLDIQNIRYAVSAFSPWITHKGTNEGIEVTLKTEVNNLSIHYTLDGTTPTIQSQKYQAPFLLKSSATVKARTFKKGKPMGYISSVNFPVHKASWAKVVLVNDKSKLKKLTDMEYAQLNHDDSAWQQIPSDAEMEIFFDEPGKISEVKFSALRHTFLSHYPPLEAEVLGSEDGMSFTSLGKVQQPAALIQGHNKIGYQIPFPPYKVKVLKLKLKGVSIIPGGHFAEGGKSSILIDEVVVN